MNARTIWSRVLIIVGLICMLIGAIDPLEGSLIILPGTGLVALGAFLGKVRHRRLDYAALLLVAVGVGAMFALAHSEASAVTAGIRCGGGSSSCRIQLVGSWGSSARSLLLSSSSNAPAELGGPQRPHLDPKSRVMQSIVLI